MACSLTYELSFDGRIVLSEKNWVWSAEYPFCGVKMVVCYIYVAVVFWFRLSDAFVASLLKT